MMNKMKFLCIILVGMLALGLSQNKVYAEENVDLIVEAYVEAMNEQDWNKFTDLYCAEEKSSLQEFFANSQNMAEHNGVLNVKGATLVELVEIDFEDAQDMLYKEYIPEDTRVYVFGVNFNVYEDTRYYSMGINYNFITCINENGEWKVSEMLPIAEPISLLEAGYEFSDNYSMAIEVMDARENGQFINYNGELFAQIDGNAVGNEISPFSVINTRTVPTSSTQVRYKNSSGTIENINFHEYCLGVLAGEVRGTSFDGEVRRAQAIAIKTFTWHYIIVPHGSAEGYDVNYSQQSYKPDKVSENSKVTTDYNAVKDVWMESYSGAIFTAYYKAGTYGDQSDYKNGGEFKQNGARWLYDNGVATTYKSLLKYYYDSSSASTGGAIRFFDGKKNEL